MSTPRPNGHGILKAARARHAEEAIGHSEGLVTVLRLTQTDMRPAEDTLKIAKDLFASQEYAKALETARRAEAIAITLDERHSGYQKSAKALRSCIEEIRRVGLPTEAFEAILGRAEEKAMAGIWENGVFVPNYLEARVLVEKAETDGRGILEHATAASNAIFLAELATEALADLPGGPDPRLFSEGAAGRLEAMLHDATRELALGNIERSMQIAKEIEERAGQLRREYIAAAHLLTATEGHLADLRGEGIATERLERHIEAAWASLARGLIEPGIDMARRLSKEAEALGGEYRAATTGIQDAEILYAQLTREGFHSYDAETAVRDARKALREGSYRRALDHLERANAAFVKRRNVRETLAKAIAETRARVQVLGEKRLPFLPDVQELLGRAEREFRDGNYSGSSEDLRIATLLLGQSGKPAGPSP